MKHRAFTFAAFNPRSSEAYVYFLVRCVVREDVRFDSREEWLWNQRKLHELRQAPEVAELANDHEHQLTVPVGLAVSVASARQVLQIEGRQLLGDIDLRRELRLGSVPKDEAAELIDSGSQLRFRPRGRPTLRTAGVYRLFPRWNERPFARSRVVKSTSFRLLGHEVAACTLRVDCPAQSVAAVVLEQWVVGTDGDLDRPTPSELLFLFPADAQIVDDIRPVCRENLGS